ncbi:MAG: bifunctional DedA family/phosphatase PAP2 family protein [Thermoplasmatota archaeon]
MATATYVVVLVAAIAEALPIVGILVPGHFLIVTAAAAATTGRVSVWIVLALAILGAIGGDLLAYALGRTFGTRLVQRFEGKFGLSAGRLAKASASVRENPFLTIIVGRFNGVTRSMAPFAAGIAQYPRARFLAYNAAGGVAWGASAVLLGYALGQAFHAAQVVLGRVAAALAIAIALILIGVVALRRVDARITKAEAAWLLTALVALTGFLLVSEGVTEGEGLSQYDPAISAWVQGHASGWRLEVLATVTAWGATLPVLAALLGGAALLWWDHQPRESARVLGLGIVTLAAVEFVKAYVARARPAGALDAGYSFPSGHTTFAALLASLAVWYAFHKHRHKSTLIASLALAALWVGLMGFSRVAVGAHFATDVLAGACLGVGLAGLGLAGPTVALRVSERGSSMLEARAARRAEKVTRRATTPSNADTPGTRRQHRRQR